MLEVQGMLEMQGMQEMLTWPSTELMQLSTGSRSPSCPATLLVSAPPPGPAPALPLVSRLYRRLLNLTD